MSKTKINWVKILNMFIFQWFFVRLVKKIDKRIEGYELYSFDIMRDGNVSSRGKGNVITYFHYNFQYWVIPLTSWKSELIYVGNRKNNIRLTKKRKVKS